MSHLYWLTDARMERLRPFFPKLCGKPRVDDRRVPRHDYETVHCAGYAVDLNSVAASDARAFCSALI
jgi:hypothetical protein